MEKSSNKLVDLSVAFAVEILNLIKYLKGQSFVTKLAEPEPVLERISTKHNMPTGNRISSQNFKSP